MAVITFLLYGTVRQANKKQHTHKINITEMRMLKLICEKNKIDKI